MKIKRWEYLKVRAHDDINLNELGYLGWELSACVNEILIFRRTMTGTGLRHYMLNNKVHELNGAGVSAIFSEEDRSERNYRAKVGRREIFYPCHHKRKGRAVGCRIKRRRK